MAALAPLAALPGGALGCHVQRTPARPLRLLPRRRRVRAAALGAAAAATAATAGVPPPDHAPAAADASRPHLAKDPATLFVALGALFAAAADALGPLLSGLAATVVAAATDRAAASSPGRAGGRALTASTSSGAGRELVVTSSQAPAGAAAITPAVQSAGRRRDSGRRLDLLSLLLAPVAPLLAPRRPATRNSSHSAAVESAAAAETSAATSSLPAAPPAAAAEQTAPPATSSAPGDPVLQLLEQLQAAAAAPGVQQDPRYDAVRALLAAAPTSGEARANFAASLLDGMAAAAEQGDDDSVFALVGELLEATVLAEAPSPAAATDHLEELLAALAAAAAAPDVQVRTAARPASNGPHWLRLAGWLGAAPFSHTHNCALPPFLFPCWLQGDRRFDDIRTLLAAAPPGGEPRRNFATSLVSE